MGQSKAGMSTLRNDPILFVFLVVERLPNIVPWKPFLKDKMPYGGDPGCEFSIAEQSSSYVGKTSKPPLLSAALAIKANL